jgi:hypothetical protein
MRDPREDDLLVHLTVDDAWTAEAAGVKFARILAGARPEELALALAEQAHLIERAIRDAGHGAEQARLAAEHFAAAARNEGQRIAGALGSAPWGQA